MKKATPIPPGFTRFLLPASQSQMMIEFPEAKKHELQAVQRKMELAEQQEQSCLKRIRNFFSSSDSSSGTTTSSGSSLSKDRGAEQQSHFEDSHSTLRMDAWTRSPPRHHQTTILTGRDERPGTVRQSTGPSHGASRSHNHNTDLTHDEMGAAKGEAKPTSSHHRKSKP